MYTKRKLFKKPNKSLVSPQRDLFKQYYFQNNQQKSQITPSNAFSILDSQSPGQQLNPYENEENNKPILNNKKSPLKETKQPSQSKQDSLQNGRNDYYYQKQVKKDDTLNFNFKEEYLEPQAFKRKTTGGGATDISYIKRTGEYEKSIDTSIEKIMNNLASPKQGSLVVRILQEVRNLIKSIEKLSKFYSCLMALIDYRTYVRKLDALLVEYKEEEYNSRKIQFDSNPNLPSKLHNDLKIICYEMTKKMQMDKKEVVLKQIRVIEDLLKQSEISLKKMNTIKDKDKLQNLNESFIKKQMLSLNMSYVRKNSNDDDGVHDELSDDSMNEGKGKQQQNTGLTNSGNTPEQNQLKVIQSNPVSNSNKISDSNRHNIFQSDRNSKSRDQREFLDKIKREFFAIFSDLQKIYIKKNPAIIKLNPSDLFQQAYDSGIAQQSYSEFIEQEFNKVGNLQKRQTQQVSAPDSKQLQLKKEINLFGNRGINRHSSAERMTQLIMMKNGIMSDKITERRDESEDEKDDTQHQSQRKTIKSSNTQSRKQLRHVSQLH